MDLVAMLDLTISFYILERISYLCAVDYRLEFLISSCIRLFRFWLFNPPVLGLGFFLPSFLPVLIVILRLTWELLWSYREFPLTAFLTALL